jgi:hypothetical protein
LPVDDLNLKKPAGQRCQHQRLTGCAIYVHRPMSCRAWSCRWLTGDEDLGDMRRPDRCHYVVDILADFVTTEEGEHVPVIQVWGDERYPDAHRDPALRAFLEKIEMPALVRFNNERGLFIVPPCRSRDGVWIEKESIWREQQHSMDDIVAVCGDPLMSNNSDGRRGGVF